MDIVFALFILFGSVMLGLNLAELLQGNSVIWYNIFSMIAAVAVIVSSAIALSRVMKD